MNKLFAYAQIAAGTLIGALSVNLFMVPNQLPSGGLSGLMLILHYLWAVPIGPTYFLVNLPALLLLYRQYGLNGLMKTVWGIAAFSLFLEVTAFTQAYAPTKNLLLATIYAGLLMGLGLGLALRAGGSTGGTSAIAKVVHHYTGMDVSKFLLVTDLAILAFATIAVSVEGILYGLIMTFLITRVIQMVMEGFSTSRCMLIISESPDDISAAIMEGVKRGVTRLDGVGEYSRQRRPVLMCVVSENEIYKAKRIVLEADPDAFVLITDAREVAGRGFTLDSEIRRIPFWATQGGD